MDKSQGKRRKNYCLEMMGTFGFDINPGHSTYFYYINRVVLTSWMVVKEWIVLYYYTYFIIMFTVIKDDLYYYVPQLCKNKCRKWKSNYIY